ncbi:MAG: hypothetical protein L6Q97_15620 [Thermoanaerobaculia bacterium]|nr:hypothetical protein [Thermoanaerobaculia bacterium]
MSGNDKLIMIKSLHTLIWVFYNIVIFYLLYAVIVNKIDVWVWVCIGLVCLEGIVLAIYRMKCPLTIVAEKYSDSDRANFDIYLPHWLAKYNKEIYTSIFSASILILFYRLLNQ